MRIASPIAAISLMLLTAHAASAQAVTGRVTSASGEPLAGVTVWNMPMDKAVTSEDGSFSLRVRQGEGETVLRFQRNGYRPYTLFVREGSITTVVLEQATDALWSPPVCKLTPEWFRGFEMAFRLPKHTRIVRPYPDEEYVTRLIRFKKKALQYTGGPRWSWGYPQQHKFFDDISEVYERDIQYIADVPTSEYRGKRSDGTYFRFIGVFGETIEYDHATKEQADYFDAIMDTMCWVRDPYRK